ncbi:hypothetical protein [Halosimplex sp. J119]
MRSTRSLHGDERAIEGLPIRLVIALVVGVASLAVMMQILGGIGPVGQEEVTIEYGADAVQEDSNGDGSPVTVNLDSITVTTKSGDPVQNAQVLIVGGSLTIDQPVVAEDSTDKNGEASGVSGDVTPEWRPDQQRGKVKIEIEPPSSGNFKDEEPNGEIIIAR